MIQICDDPFEVKLGDNYEVRFSYFLFKTILDVLINICL